MTPEDQKAKVRSVVDEAYNKGNVNALDEIVATDVVFHRPPGPDVKGLDAYKRMVVDLLKAFSDIQFTIDEFIMEGDTDAMRYTFCGTHTGQLPTLSIPPTGKKVTITGLVMVRTVNGKAVEEWDYADMLGLMQQLGIAPPIGKAEG